MNFDPMDNILKQAANRIRGLLATADIELTAHDLKLIEALDTFSIDSTSPPETASDALRIALHLVTSERRTSHGEMISVFDKVAALWSAYLGSKRDLDSLPLEASEICDMMELLKIARRRSGAFNLDDYIDGAGYAACAFECRADEEAREPVKSGGE